MTYDYLQLVDIVPDINHAWVRVNSITIPSEEKLSTVAVGKPTIHHPREAIIAVLISVQEFIVNNPIISDLNKQ